MAPPLAPPPLAKTASSPSQPTVLHSLDNYTTQHSTAQHTRQAGTTLRRKALVCASSPCLCVLWYLRELLDERVLDVRGGVVSKGGEVRGHVLKAAQLRPERTHVRQQEAAQARLLHWRQGQGTHLPQHSTHRPRAQEAQTHRLTHTSDQDQRVCLCLPVCCPCVRGRGRACGGGRPAGSDTGTRLLGPIPGLCPAPKTGPTGTAAGPSNSTNCTTRYITVTYITTLNPAATPNG